MKKVKVMLSMFMVLVIISVSITPILAEDIKMFETEMVETETISIEDEYIIADEENKGPYNNDQKIICNATVDEDFDESSVLVVLKNEASLDFDEFSCPDFAEVNPKNVREITEVRSNRIFNDFSSKKAEYATELKNIAVTSSDLSRNSVITSVNETLSSVDNKIIEENAEVIAKAELGEEYSSFHKILCIDLNTSDKQSVLDTIKVLEKHEDVLSAEPNYITQACKIPNDTYYCEQWGMGNASLPDAWDIKTGSSSVLVGVIDDGIDASHYDLFSRINSTLNKSFVSDVSPYISTNGHGTSVAGVIGAVGNNAYGVSGVCWNVSLVSLQHSYLNGKTYIKEAVDAINYAEENNIPILNYSYTFKGSSPAFETAVNNYSGILIVSAGNDDVDIDNATDSVARYPSLYNSSKIISVAAIGSDNYLTDFSNYGVNSVDIAAPGKDIYTTVNGGGYDYVDGTSFSAPYVTGVAALIKTLYPSISNYGIRKAILDSADVMTSLQGTNKTYGKLNAEAALNIAGTCYYTIQYKANGGAGSMANTTVRYGFYSRLRDLAYSKAGYSFLGWDARRVSDNKHRYKYGTITGKWYVEGTQPQGFEKELYSNEASVAHTTLVDGDIIVMTAQWVPISYSINYEANGGLGSMSDSIGCTGQSVQLSANEFTKEHSKFIGWYLVDSDGYWSVTNNLEWEDGTPDVDELKLYSDEDSVVYTADHEGVELNAIAQWILLGDIDLDGEISIMDVTAIQMYFSGSLTLTEEQIERGDFDEDGSFSIMDATAIQIYLSLSN